MKRAFETGASSGALGAAGHGSGEAAGHQGNQNDLGTVTTETAGQLGHACNCGVRGD